MGKKRKQLSHEEIWDDSALVDSWNAALQEYQLYHSIHARGERVEDVLKEVEASEQSLTTQELQAGQTSPPIVHGLPDLEDLEDGEVEDEDGRNESSAAAGAKLEPVQNGEEIVEQQHGVPSATPGSVTHNMPGTLMHGIHDEGVKNLMMSWYYAGYYTGLYEGRKQSSSNATNGSGSERTDK